MYWTSFRSICELYTSRKIQNLLPSLVKEIEVEMVSVKIAVWPSRFSFVQLHLVRWRSPRVVETRLPGDSVIVCISYREIGFIPDVHGGSHLKRGENQCTRARFWGI